MSWRHLQNILWLLCLAAAVGIAIYRHFWYKPEWYKRNVEPVEEYLDSLGKMESKDTITVEDVEEAMPPWLLDQPENEGKAE